MQIATMYVGKENVHTTDCSYSQPSIFRHCLFTAVCGGMSRVT